MDGNMIEFNHSSQCMFFWIILLMVNTKIVMVRFHTTKKKSEETYYLQYTTDLRVRRRLLAQKLLQ